MATSFTRDITRDIPLASVGSTAAQAIETTGKAIAQGIGIFGGAAYDAYKSYQDENAKKQMEEEKEKFTGFAAQQQIKQGEQLLTGAKEARRTAFETGEFALGAEKDAVVEELTSKLSAMKEGYAQKRIGLGEYLSRQQSIAQKWIAQFPGRADEIRREVARISGVRGIEDYAFETYLKDRFNEAESAGKRAAQEAEEERKQTIKRAEQLLNGGYVKGFSNASQVANAIQSADPNVVAALNQMDTEEAFKRQSEGLKRQIETNRLTLEEGGRVFTGNLIASASTNAFQGLVSVRQEFAPIAQKISQLRVKNGGAFTVSDVDGFRAELAPFQAKATGVVNAAFDAAVQQLSMSNLARQSSADFNARVKELTEARKGVLEMVNSDDMGVIANTLEAVSKVNKDSIASTFQLIQSQNEILKAHGIAAVDLFMLTNDPETFKKKYPRAFEVLSATMPGITAGAQRIAALTGSATLQTINQATQSSFTTGQTPPVDAKTREAVLEKALALNPASQLAAVGGGVFPERPQVVGALSAIISSIPKESISGPHLAYAVQNYNNIKKAYDTMSPEEKSMLKQAWNSNVERLSGERSVSAVVNKEVEAIRARGNVDVQLIATPDGRYSFMLQRKDPRGTADIFATGVDLEQARLTSVIRYANAITDINNLLSDGKVPANPPAPAADNVQPQPGGSLAVTDKQRALDDVAAIQRELKRLTPKPSWQSQASWDEQKRILERELESAQKRAQ